MRIKVATQTPLPKHQCWFGITTSLEKQTIHHLRKKIVKDLELECEPVNIKLLLDDYSLLPQTSIAALVRDGDLITVKQEGPKNKAATSKKRKSSTLIEEKTEKKKDDIEPRPVKKTKTSEKHKEKDAKTEKIIKAEKVSKKDTEKPIKKESKKDTKKDIKKETEKGSNKNSKKKIKKLIKPEHPQGKPFEGIIKTKKRNMRRRLLKKSLRDVPISNTHYITPAPAIITSDPELQVEKLNISEPTSTHLFKQNKNKNKHHLKKASKVAETQSHVHYLDKPVDSVETVKETNHGNHVNHYGRAFVTLTESEPQCQGRRGPVHEYPIHRVPTLFYAEKAMEHEPQVPQAEIQQPEAEYQPIMSSSSVSVPVDYDSYPDVDFIKNIPSIGTHLAIKTLELTANYTPEISDWKQVTLKALDDSNVTVEYQQGFGKASTKGGKFDIKKHLKKQYDDWGYELVDEDEELEQDSMQEGQDMIETIPMADVFAIKNMS